MGPKVTCLIVSADQDGFRAAVPLYLPWRHDPRRYQTMTMSMIMCPARAMSLRHAQYLLVAACREALRADEGGRSLP
jgi:hypothetical protein